MTTATADRGRCSRPTARDVAPRRPARRSSRRTRRREALGTRPGRPRRRPRCLRGRPDDGFRELADPEYLEGTQRRRPGDRPVLWRALAADGRRRARVPRRRRGASGATGCSRSPTGCSASPSSSPAGSRSASSTGSCPTSRSAPGSSCAEPRREAGDWITVDSLAHPFGTRHPPRALPLGRARAARLLALALGAPARRLDDRHAAVRRPPARPRARDRRRHGLAPPRRADRRRRAGRPEGAVVGAPVAGPASTGRGPAASEREADLAVADRRRPPCVGPPRHPRQARPRRRRRDRATAWAASAAGLAPPSTSRAAATAAAIRGRRRGCRPRPPIADRFTDIA